MNQDPRTWRSPQWHEDFGVAQEQLHMLKEFSLVLLEARPEYEVNLECFEEGYMKVDIFREGHLLGELCVVEKEEGLAYALFTNIGEKDEDERYFFQIEEGLGFL